ncbi:MAG TPA: beta-ribofuranosylaminobenzene 5'-phosphate synthase family protein [Gemmataceae bacterium]|jgi:beta-ribofuranosylaminobenzene 5'-phosphate synthase|nr:beta-ribofuranosylaminobenzene 5'-phosphate synthase family protein [Gemmataceae bacterium]
MLVLIALCILPFLVCASVVRVRTGSRLHFGLLSLPSPAEPAEGADGQARQFGGVGMMVDAPGVSVSGEPAGDWSAEGPLAERVLSFARGMAHALPAGAILPHRFRIENAALEHVGLGTGTQLGLAVARILSAGAGMVDLSATALARFVGRGARSAIGIHGFDHGGLVVEAGKRASSAVAPLVAQLPIPPAWRLVLAVPPWGSGLHGTEETAAFSRLQSTKEGASASAALCALILRDLLPAVVENDLQAFGAAVYTFNRRVGSMFASLQGGIYSHPRTAELVSFIRGEGIAGVGQSSWGPAVFAIVEDDDRANNLVQNVEKQFALRRTDLIVTRARNEGADHAPARVTTGCTKKQ